MGSIFFSDLVFYRTIILYERDKGHITIKMAVNVPKKQMAQVIEKTGGPVQFKEIDVQQPGPDEVLINIKYSGVCHTDLHAVNGDWPLPTKLPLVGGHEGAGVVVARGQLVEDIEIGEHAGVKWINGTCLACDFCQQADEPLCAKALLSGYTVDGSFQQYCITKAAHVARLHKDIPLDAVAPVLCAGITVYKGLKESGAKPGQTVAIVGAGGGLGSLAQQYAKAMGLRTIAIDSGDEKKKMCMEQLGSYAFVDFAKSNNVVKEVQEATEDGLGPHAVILVAVNEKPFQQAAEYVRPRGSVVCIGLPAGAYLKAPVFESVIKMVTIKGPFKVVGLSELQKVYDLMHQGQIAGRYVLDT